jgi:hypothetical protein
VALIVLARKIMQKFAPIGILCEHRDTGLKELSRLSRMLAEPFQATVNGATARDYVESAAELRGIRLQMADLREMLAEHRAEHGC